MQEQLRLATQQTHAIEQEKERKKKQKKARKQKQTQEQLLKQEQFERLLLQQCIEQNKKEALRAAGAQGVAGGGGGRAGGGGGGGGAGGGGGGGGGEVDPHKPSAAGTAVLLPKVPGSVYAGALVDGGYCRKRLGLSSQALLSRAGMRDSQHVKFSDNEYIDPCMYVHMYIDPYLFVRQLAIFFPYFFHLSSFFFLFPPPLFWFVLPSFLAPKWLCCVLHSFALRLQCSPLASAIKQRCGKYVPCIPLQF